MKITFFTMGGTIDKVYFDELSDYRVGPPSIDEILKTAKVTLSYEIISLLKKDSLDMTWEDREMIRDKIEQNPANRIIITHGTDTMVETARHLKTIKGKTIVFTGAMAPACFKSSDATFNIAFALSAVQTLAPGVYIAMGGSILNPEKVRKNRKLQRFESIEKK